MLCASFVVNRSSQVSTGYAVPARQPSTKSRVSAACGPSSPDRLSGQPDEHHVGVLLFDHARDRAPAPLGEPGSGTGSSGVARVPVGSLMAQPQRALP